MEIANQQIDHGKPFDWGKISSDYARFRDIYPQEKWDQNLKLKRHFEEKMGKGLYTVAGEND